MTKPICTCTLLPRGDVASDPDCPTHGVVTRVQRVIEHEQIYDCTKDWADPRCPEHSGAVLFGIPGQDCICRPAPAPADIDCPVHGSPHACKCVGQTIPGQRHPDWDCPRHGDQCPLHHDACPRDGECSWWEARRSGVPWSNPVGEPIPPRIVPGLDGTWKVQGSGRIVDVSPVTVREAAAREQDIALDVAAKLRKIAEHWYQAAQRASAKLGAEPSGTERRRLYAVQVVTYTDTYQHLERDAVALETGQDFEGDGQ